MPTIMTFTAVEGNRINRLVSVRHWSKGSMWASTHLVRNSVAHRLDAAKWDNRKGATFPLPLPGSPEAAPRTKSRHSWQSTCCGPTVHKPNEIKGTTAVDRPQVRQCVPTSPDPLVAQSVAIPETSCQNVEAPQTRVWPRRTDREVPTVSPKRNWRASTNI